MRVILLGAKINQQKKYKNIRCCIFSKIEQILDALCRLVRKQRKIDNVAIF